MVKIFIGDLDLHNIIKGVKQVNYYDLGKEDRWLEGDSPYEVGGRGTDISQIAYSLKHRVRELFPINEVPDKLVRNLIELEKICAVTEKAIEASISLISDYMRTDK